MTAHPHPKIVAQREALKRLPKPPLEKVLAQAEASRRWREANPDKSDHIRDATKKVSDGANAQADTRRQ